MPRREFLSAITAIGCALVALLAAAMPAEAQVQTPETAAPAPADSPPEPGRSAPEEAVQPPAQAAEAQAPEPPRLAQLLPGIPPIEVPTPNPNPEETEGPKGVLQRERPELEPLGIQTPAGMLLPSASFSGIFDSNIFATEKKPTGDFVFHLHPDLKLDSGEGIFRYLLDGYSELVDYGKHGTLSNGNVGASAGLAYAPTRDFNLQSQTAARYAHQDPASFSVSVPNAAVRKLPPYSVLTETLSATRDFRRLGLSLTSGFQREDYSNITIGGVTFNQSVLDANAYSIGPKISYAITPLTRGFVQVQLLRREYDRPLRNSTTYTLTTGSDFEFTRLIKGSAFAGYNVRHYDSALIGTVASPGYGLNVAWYPTELMTVLFNGKQDFADTTVTGATGVPSVLDVKTFSTEVDYEILRELIASLSGSFETDNYSRITRVDNTVTAGGVLTYALNRNASLFGQYKFTNRMSSVAGFSYDRHQIGVGLRVQY